MNSFHCVQAGITWKELKASFQNNGEFLRIQFTENCLTYNSYKSMEGILICRDDICRKVVAIDISRDVLPNEIIQHEGDKIGKYHHDFQADALYIELTSNDKIYSTEQDDNYNIMFDLDENGKVLGIEVLDASKILGSSPVQE
jgi:uncharacterized protein YuzE